MTESSSARVPDPANATSSRSQSNRRRSRRVALSVGFAILVMGAGCVVLLLVNRSEIIEWYHYRKIEGVWTNRRLEFDDPKMQGRGRFMLPTFGERIRFRSDRTLENPEVWGEEPLPFDFEKGTLHFHVLSQTITVSYELSESGELILVGKWYRTIYSRP